MLASTVTANAYAAAPKILFSDMTDAPVTGWEGSSTKGAAVSIYCRNIGTSRGSSYVTVGGVNLTHDSDYAEWGATTNPTVPLGMQRITFFLNSSMKTGGSYPNTTISVTTPEGTSATIPFHTRALGSNHIYIFNAQNSPSWARENLVAGDVCYLRGGTYSAEDDGTATHGWARGGNFSFCYGSPKNFHDGIEGKSITVSAYPGESVNFEAVNRSNDRPASFINFIYTEVKYWTFSKIKINALRPITVSDNVTPPYDSSMTHIRFVNLDITTPWSDNTDMGNYAYGDGMDLVGGKGSNYLYILGCYIHDICADYRGQPPANPDASRSYNIYFNGYGTTDYVYIGWNDLGWNTAGRGVQFFGHKDGDRLDHLYFHDNWVHDTRRQGVVFGGEGGDHDYSFIQNAYIYNNIITNTGTGDVALQMGGSYGNGKYGGTYYVYNNILDGSNNNGYPTLHVGYDLDHLYLQNNIILGIPNQWNYYTYFPSDPIPANHVTADHNIYYGAGSNSKPSWDNSTLSNTKPLFISDNPQSFQDYQLQDGSPAIHAGTNNLQFTLTQDFMAKGRGTPPDIGPFEYSDEVAPPTFMISITKILLTD